MPSSSGSLSASLTAFTRRLRQAGLTVGPAETADALQAMGLLTLLDPLTQRDALRMILTARHSERATFDALFDQHFLQHDIEEVPGASPPAASSPDAAPDTPPEDADGLETPQLHPLGETAGDDEQDAGDTARSLRSQLSPHAGQGEAPQAHADDLTPLLHAASALVRQVRLGHARRWKAMPRGPRFDFRRTLHAALRTSGDPAQVRYQGHPRRRPRFLLVLDGSRSMAAHTGLLLRYAAALQLRSQQVELYTFSTGLTRLTPQLRLATRTHGRRLELQLPPLGDAWGGGTRIGESLLRLAHDEQARLSPDTLVLILSDGLDTGEPEVLARALRELRRRSGLLVWLNPLAGLPGYQPLARGMAAALPLVDVFAAADGVPALAALPGQLRRLSRG
ncbi:vWA domain-containing protein [Deinococcus sonorensis]|uniref:VWA domain-containing protein n=2 Tax=Deinococcus sonorensis TaxID=309891 RepID=A0AAU7UBV1_9DEIO